MRTIARLAVQNSIERGKYDVFDLDELCLWLYGIYEETTLESK